MPIPSFGIEPVVAGLFSGMKTAVNCFGQLMVTMIVSLEACDVSVKLPFHSENEYPVAGIAYSCTL